jgi:flagellum-specific peptidoglycan hydrolase FlgJ
MKVSRIILCVWVVSFAVSCGSKKSAVTKKNKTKEVIDRTTTEPEAKETATTTKPPSSTEMYIEEFAEIAMRQMRTAKIPASITLAQGILESGSGRGRLAVEANNHFGIKCHGWKGAKIYHDDDRSQECFRKYNQAESSYRDHSEFLTGRKRYANLFRLKPDDYKAWAKGLKAAGYATDRKYPQKLISLIERYELYRYDAEVLGSDSEDKELVKVNSGVLRYIVERGDTLYSLAKRYKTTVEAIKELNNLTTNNLALGQELMIPN